MIGLLMGSTFVVLLNEMLLGVALPTLIEWGATHPATHLPEAGLHLEGLRLGGAHGAAVQSALQTLGMSPCCPLDTDHRKPALAVSIGTPRGTVLLTCPSAVR